MRNPFNEEIEKSQLSYMVTSGRLPKSLSWNSGVQELKTSEMVVQQLANFSNQECRLESGHS